MLITNNEKLKRALSRFNSGLFSDINLLLAYVDVIISNEDTEKCIYKVTYNDKNQAQIQFVFNSDFIEEIDELHLAYCILHLSLHIMARHYSRRKLPNDVSHLAQDLVLHSLIIGWSSAYNTFKDFEEFQKFDVYYQIILKEFKDFFSDTEIFLFENVFELLCFLSETNKGKGNGNGKSEESQENTESDELSEFFNKFDDDSPTNLSTIDKFNLDQFTEKVEKQIQMQRGSSPSDFMGILGKLKQSPKDPLEKLVSLALMRSEQSAKTRRTYQKGHYYGIKGLKGRQDLGCKINIILDTSGSMGGGVIEMVMAYVNHNGYTFNLIQIDASVKEDMIKYDCTAEDFQNLELKGFGGTCLNPAIKYIIEDPNDMQLNQNPTVILTDGFCDLLADINDLLHCLIISPNIPPLPKVGNHVEYIQIKN